MRIIHAHKYFYLRRGAERYMLTLMREQERLGHTVAPFSMHYPKNEPSPWSDFFVSELATESGAGKGMSALRQAIRAAWSFEAYKKMRAMIRAFKPDIVHVHNLYTHLSPSVLAACKKEGIPVVMSVHDYALVSANYNLWDKNAPMNLKRLGVLATARTRFIKHSFLATFALDLIQKTHNYFGLYEKNISRFLVSTRFVERVLVENGYPKEKMFVEGLMMHENAVLEPRARVARKDFVLFVGSLEKNKGVQTLLRAMEAYPDVRLKIAGTGPYESELRQLAKGKVEFLGFVQGERLAELMQRARVTVVPSLWYEPYGLVAVESMGYGTPVIVSDRGGLPELVEDGISGRIFQSGNVRSLTETLREFIHSPAYARKMGEQAKKRAFAIANPEKHVQKILEHYRVVIDG